MILLWVMSLLLYLCWVIAQFEPLLALEIQSQAVQTAHQSEFARTESLLVLCEDQLRSLLIHNPDTFDDQFDALEPLGCQAQVVSDVRTANPKNDQTKKERRIEIVVGQTVRLRSVLQHQIPSKNLMRINWQVLYE